MEGPVTNIRGLINDLTRTLTGSLVHMDNLLLHLDNDSGEFDDAWLANHQLERALEFFIELRSEYMIQQKSINQKERNFYKFTANEKLLHKFNNLLAVIVGYCDILQNDIAAVRHISQITEYIYKFIHNPDYFLNETNCLPEGNVSMNKVKLSYRKLKQTKTASYEKSYVNNNILLVEDDEDVKEIISTFLIKHGFPVVACSNWNEALAIFDKSRAPFVIYIIDVGLPDIEGPNLVNNILIKKSDIKVLFISGYDETNLRKHFPLMSQYQILVKPFRLEELLNKIRSAVIH